MFSADLSIKMSIFIQLWLIWDETTTGKPLLQIFLYDISRKKRTDFTSKCRSESEDTMFGLEAKVTELMILHSSNEVSYMQESRWIALLIMYSYIVNFNYIEQLFYFVMYYLCVQGLNWGVYTHTHTYICEGRLKCW